MVKNRRLKKERMSVRIVKAKGVQPDEFENVLVKELSAIASGSSAIAAKLAGLQILAAKEVPVSASKKAVVVFVPFKLMTHYKRIQTQLISELEKRLTDRQVVIVAQRTILSPNFTRKAGVKAGSVRPYSRTLKAVHEALLEDLVYPVEIVGKRTRYKTDGSKTLKVLLEGRKKDEVDDRLDTFAAVYSKLTNKNVVFMFPLDN